MESTENFFKHRIFFTNEEESFNEENQYISLKTIYKSQTVNYNVNTVNKLIVKIRPFIKLN